MNGDRGGGGGGERAVDSGLGGEMQQESSVGEAEISRKECWCKGHLIVSVVPLRPKSVGSLPA